MAIRSSKSRNSELSSPYTVPIEKVYKPVAPIKKRHEMIKKIIEKPKTDFLKVMFASEQNHNNTYRNVEQQILDY